MKKHLLLALITIMLASCSGNDNKIDPKKDADDMAKALVDIVNRHNVNSQAQLDSLKAEVDSVEATLYKIYAASKYSEQATKSLDSLKHYYNLNGRKNVDNALNKKQQQIPAEPEPTEN